MHFYFKLFSSQQRARRGRIASDASSLEGSDAVSSTDIINNY